MLKLKLKYFSHVIWNTNSLEKTLMLGWIEGRRRRRQQWMRWLDDITNTMAMSLSNLWEMVKDREAWHAAVHRVTKIQTWLSNWTTKIGVACSWLSDPVANFVSNKINIDHFDHHFSQFSSNHLILCCPLLLPPSIFPTIRIFSNVSVLCIRWPKYWSFSFSISASNEYSGLVSFRMDWMDLIAVQGTLKSLLQHHSSNASVLQCSAFFIVQL